jgi:ABC-type multidrug transport system fused ATPase/permease subunit
MNYFRQGQPHAAPDTSQKPTRPFGTTLKRLWHYMGPHRKLYVTGLSLGIVDAVCQASIPLFFRYVLNEIQTDTAVFMAQKFWMALGIGAIVTIGFFPAAYLFHVLVGIALARYGRFLRTSLYEHVSRLSADFFQRNRVGEITSRMNNDLDVVTGSMGMFMAMMWSTIVLIQGLAMMYWINVPLAVIMTLLLAGVAFFTRSYLPMIRRMSRKVRDAIGQVSATVTEYISIHELIRSFSREEVIDEKVDRSGEYAQKQAEYLTWRQHAFMDVLQMMVNFVAPMTLLFIGAWMLMYSVTVADTCPMASRTLRLIFRIMGR